MTKDEALKLALYALDYARRPDKSDRYERDIIMDAIIGVMGAIGRQSECKDTPHHGWDMKASRAAGRYVCICALDDVKEINDPHLDLRFVRVR